MTQTIMRPRQITSPLRLKVALREARAREEWASRPTQITGAVRPLPSRITKPLLPLDAWGRPFLAVISPYEETGLLVEAVVARYCSLQESPLAVICLSAFRHFTFGMWVKGYRLPSGQIIPYAYEEAGGVYDVLCRGEEVDAWVR